MIFSYFTKSFDMQQLLIVTVSTVSCEFCCALCLQHFSVILFSHLILTVSFLVFIASKIIIVVVVVFCGNYCNCTLLAVISPWFISRLCVDRLTAGVITAMGSLVWVTMATSKPLAGSQPYRESTFYRWQTKTSEY